MDTILKASSMPVIIDAHQRPSFSIEWQESMTGPRKKPKGPISKGKKGTTHQHRKESRIRQHQKEHRILQHHKELEEESRKYKGYGLKIEKDKDGEKTECAWQRGGGYIQKTSIEPRKYNKNYNLPTRRSNVRHLQKLSSGPTL